MTDFVWTSPDVGTITRPTVQSKLVWTDDWDDEATWQVEIVRWAAAPSMPMATLTRTYGKGQAAAAATMATVSRLSSTILRKFVKISVPNYTDDANLEWWGVLVGIDDDRHGVEDGVAFGVQTLHCLGLEHLLDQHKITRGKFQYVTGTGPVTYDVQATQRGLVFNRDGKANRSPDKWNSSHYVFQADDTEAPEFWLVEDALGYAVNELFPLAEDESQLIEWKLDNLFAVYPDWRVQELDTHGLTPRQVVNALLPRQRLLSWKLVVDEGAGTGGSDTVVLTPFSFNKTAITTDLGNLPANSDVHTVDVDADHTAIVRVRYDAAQVYHQVRVQGARQTVAISLEPADSNIVAGWSSTIETSYESAASAASGYPASGETEARRRWNREYRAQPRFDAVYSRFVFPPEWDQAASRATGTELIDDRLVFQRDLEMLPYLPFLAGYEYTAAALDTEVTATKVDSAADDKTWQPPKVIAKYPRTASRYMDATQIGRGAENVLAAEAEDARFSLAVGIVKGSLSVRVQGAPQHAIAHTDYSGTAVESAADDRPVLDWQDWIYTVAIERDKWCEGVYPDDDDLPLSTVIQKLVVDAGPKYRLDWGLEGCATHVSSTGAVQRLGDTVTIRDDRPQLQSLARLAFEWYALPRVACEISTELINANLEIGFFLDKIEGADETTVGSVVTEITVVAGVARTKENITFRPYRMTISTQFGELDLLSIHNWR